MSKIQDPITVPTSQGPAAVRVHAPTGGSPRGSIVLGHGAGGGLGSWPKDLQSVLAATAHGWTVVLVEQPWRVAGRKVATRPPTLDAAWLEVVPALLGRAAHGPEAAASPPSNMPLPSTLPLPLVVGGRSAGARVACRTSPGDPAAGLPRADAVLCLSFPLHPPGKPEKSRVAELETPVALGIPTLVVQGASDPFGTPEEFPTPSGSLELVQVPGSHSPSPDQSLVTQTILTWLDRLS